MDDGYLGDTYTIYRNDEPIRLIHYNSDRIQEDLSHALTAAALLSALAPEDAIIVRTQYGEIVRRFRDGFEY